MKATNTAYGTLSTLGLMVLIGSADLAHADPWYGGPYAGTIGEGQAPSAFYLNNDPNQFYVYFFDDSNVPGDDVYFSFNRGPRKKIVPRTNWLVADDFEAAAAPTVIEHPNPGLYGMTRYVMYYECAKMHFNRDNLQQTVPMYVEICVAGSNDLVNWKKYNSAVGFHTGTPTSVLKFSSARKAECGEQIVGDRWAWSYSKPLCKSIFFDAYLENYGVGHPSAIAYPETALIDLYYTNSLPDSGPKLMMWRSRTWDGIHFFDPQLTNLPGGYTVRFHKPSHTYIATANYNSQNRFFLSSDGLNFTGPYYMVSYTGSVVYDGSIVSDQFGQINSWNVPFVSSEGTPCLAVPNCPGGTSTWFMHLIKGTFFGAP